MNLKQTICLVLITICFFINSNGQINNSTHQSLHIKEKGIIAISAYTGKGDLKNLHTALNKGLDAGLNINQIKEVLVHTYAYSGFPRSIRGLQTFMEVLDARKAKGIKDELGKEASPISQKENKYERGRKILDTLVHALQSRPVSAYGSFAPVIDTFLKEHLFADLFQRDVLTYAERELVTLSVISAIGKAEPMLRSHFTVALNVGLTPAQLKEFVAIISQTLGKTEGNSAKKVLNEVLK